MGISATLLDYGSTQSLTEYDSQNTNSVTPHAGKLYVLDIVHYNATGNGDTVPPTNVAGAGLTFSLIAYIDDTSNTSACLSRWAATGTPSTGAITITFYGGRGTYMCNWSLYEITGADLTSGTTSAFVQTVQNENYNGNTNTQSITLATFGSPSNGAIAAWNGIVSTGTVPTAIPKSGWTEISDNGISFFSSTNASSLETQIIASQDTSPLVTWSANAFMFGIASEIKSGAINMGVTPTAGSDNCTGNTPTVIKGVNTVVTPFVARRSGLFVPDKRIFLPNRKPFLPLKAA